MALAGAVAVTVQVPVPLMVSAPVAGSTLQTAAGAALYWTVVTAPVGARRAGAPSPWVIWLRL